MHQLTDEGLGILWVGIAALRDHHLPLMHSTPRDGAFVGHKEAVWGALMSLVKYPFHQEEPIRGVVWHLSNLHEIACAVETLSIVCEAFHREESRDIWRKRSRDDITRARELCVKCPLGTVPRSLADAVNDLGY